MKQVVVREGHNLRLSRTTDHGAFEQSMIADAPIIRVSKDATELSVVAHTLRLTGLIASQSQQPMMMLVGDSLRAVVIVTGPAVVAGSLLLLNKIALALFIGLGPLFILCLLFKQTAPLFQKWLLYGIGTVFSLAVLSIMDTLSMKVLTPITDVTKQSGDLVNPPASRS